MPVVLRSAALALLAGAVLAVPAGAAAPAASCPGVTGTADTFAQVGPAEGTWLENMGFDGHGGMWVSELVGDRLVRFDAQAHEGAALTLTGPGASLPGPDGRMYALYGDSAKTVPNTGGAGVVSFDPLSPNPVAKPFASGLDMANGAAFDTAGNLYVADTVTMGAGLIKLRPDGSRDASFTTDVPVSGADGIAIAGGTLYATLFNDPNATIVRVPLAAPRSYGTLTQLSPTGTAPAFPDDATIGPDGQLWVATNVGDLDRVDLATGASCVVWSGTGTLDSVRFARGFPPFDDAQDLFLTSESGTLTHVHLSGPAAPAPAGFAPAPPTTHALPAIGLSVTPKHLRRGHRRTLTATVRSSVRACVVDVTVRLGTLSGRTDAGGRTRLRYRPRHRGLRTLRAAKAGCASATAHVRVRR